MKELLVTLAMFTLITGYSQTYQTDLIQIGETNPINWTTYLSNSDFKIEYKLTECDPAYGYDAEYVVIRITNLTSSKMALSWNMDIYYQGKCKTCNYPEEYGYQLGVAPNQTLSGDCEMDANYRLKIFSKFTDPKAKNTSILSAFQLNNLKVKF
ncbi:MAG: hypothetical protein WDZ35_05710 [Crocinitomicaceae bacterium]